MKLLLINLSRPDPLVRRVWIEKWLKNLSRQLGKRGHKISANQELVVVFVSSREMRRMNLLYRRHNNSTDILSFAGTDDSSVGELVLCLPIIRRHSKASGLTPRGELGYMLIHGVLHLLGYDHERPKAKREMFTLQDELYAEITGAE